MSERLRHLEAAEQYLTGGADPNGIVNAAEGTPFWDNVNDELYYNTDGVTTWQIIGGGGGGPALPHNILSVTHSDTTPAAVVRGDLATGQGIAPTTWTRLPLGGVGQAVVSDGADVVWGAPAIAVHNLLSATHGDTVVNAATRGSLVYGNATPAWDELVIGGIAGSVVTRDAADMLWSSYGLVGTAAQTYTFPPASATLVGGTGAANQVTYWNGVNTITGAATFTYNPAVNPNTLIIAANAAHVPLVVRGAVGQAQPLTEWQDSGGVVRASINSLFEARFFPRNASTNTITNALNIAHLTSGGAAAGLGVNMYMYLQDSATGVQIASEVATLWATATAGAESPLYRVTTYPAGTAGPGYSGHWTWRALSNTARTVIPNGAGDVTATMTLLFAISESGGGAAGGM